MGLYDIINNRGAGVLSEDQSKALYEQGIAHPQYQEMMQQLVNPRNMDTGMKLALLGQAMQGGDITGKITDYQSGIRERFRQRQQDKRQLSRDELEKRRVELGMKNTQLGMDQTQLNMDQSVQKFPYEQQQLRGQIAQDQQSYAQNATADAQWVGDHLTGRVMQLNKRTGQLEDVTHMYSQAQIEAFKASKKPAQTGKSTINPGVGRTLSEAERQRDKTFAKDLEKYRPEQVSGNIGVLTMIADELSTEEAGDSTGLALSSPLQSFARIIDREGDMGLRAILDQDGIDKQQIVAGVIQKNLRETLGAQFTQKEGMLLIDRAYNPTLPPQMNAKRLKALAMLAEAALKAKQEKVEYFNGNNGSLAGYNPQMDAGLELMKAQVLQVYAANGGTATGGSGTGTTSTGVGFSVSAPQAATTP